MRTMKKLKRGTPIYYIENRIVKRGLIEEVIALPNSKPSYYVQIGRDGYNKYVGTTVFLTKFEAYQELISKLTRQRDKISSRLKEIKIEIGVS